MPMLCKFHESREHSRPEILRLLPLKCFDSLKWIRAPGILKYFSLFWLIFYTICIPLLFIGVHGISQKMSSLKSKKINIILKIYASQSENPKLVKILFCILRILNNANITLPHIN